MPTPTDRFDESELYPDGADHRGTQEFEALPKKADGSFDIEAMTPEQKALFWESRYVHTRTGHNKYREQTERDLEILRKATELANQNGGGQRPQHTDNFGDDDEFKELGLDEKGTEVFRKAIEIGERRTLNRLGANPVFQQSVATGNKLRLNDAFSRLSTEKGYEYVNDYRNEIVQDNFSDPTSYPPDDDTLLEVLRKVAGNVLWSHRDEIALKKKPQHDQVDMLGGHGGNKQQTAPVRSMEYWERLAKEDPQKFASPDMQKLFNEDMEKIKEE